MIMEKETRGDDRKQRGKGDVKLLQHCPLGEVWFDMRDEQSMEMEDVLLGPPSVLTDNAVTSSSPSSSRMRLKGRRSSMNWPLRLLLPGLLLVLACLPLMCTVLVGFFSAEVWVRSQREVDSRNKRWSPSKDLLPDQEVGARVHFRAAGGVRGQVVEHSSKRQLGPGTRLCRLGR